MPKKQPPSEPSDPRDEIVAQGNDLIRHARFPLTSLEQNIIYFVMSKVKPTDVDFMRQTFTVAEFCDVCGIISGDRSGANYRTIKAAVKSVADKSAWVEFPNGKESLVRWFDTYDIDKNTGEMTAVLSQSIKPYLLGLIERVKAGGEGYTQTHLYTYLAMQSKYSKRLYEILKSYLYSAGNQEKTYRLQFKEYELNAIKQQMNAYVYVRWEDFKRFALNPAVEEINKVSDIIVSYTTKKNGRKIVGVDFSFQHKQRQEQLGSEERAKEILNTPRRSPSPKAKTKTEPTPEMLQKLQNTYDDFEDMKAEKPSKNTNIPQKEKDYSTYIKFVLAALKNGKKPGSAFFETKKAGGDIPCKEEQLCIIEGLKEQLELLNDE
jgi:plasmid replication initiation protein